MAAAKKPTHIFAEPLYKVAALGLAVVLWFFSISNSQFEADVTLPIEIRNMRAGKALGEEAPRTATVRFRSTGRSLAKLYILKPFSDMKLVLDLERVQRRHVFHLDEYLRDNPQRISIPVVGMRENLQFVEVVQPDSVLIVLGDYTEKLVPVRPQVTIGIAPGHIQVGPLEITPDKVMVRGVVEAVRDVEDVRTMRQSYPESTTPLEFTVGLQHPDPGKVLDVAPINVTIRANIQILGERRLEDVPVRVINLPDNLNVFVSPSTVDLTVIGGVEFLARPDSELVRITVDYLTQWSPTVTYVEPTVTTHPHLERYGELLPRQLELITTRQIQ